MSLGGAKTTAPAKRISDSAARPAASSGCLERKWNMAALKVSKRTRANNASPLTISFQSRLAKNLLSLGSARTCSRRRDTTTPARIMPPITMAHDSEIERGDTSSDLGMFRENVEDDSA
jgi:hypothetical protein